MARGTYTHSSFDDQRLYNLHPVVQQYPLGQISCTLDFTVSATLPGSHSPLSFPSHHHSHPSCPSPPQCHPFLLLIPSSPPSPHPPLSPPPTCCPSPPARPLLPLPSFPSTPPLLLPSPISPFPTTIPARGQIQCCQSPRTCTG